MVVLSPLVTNLGCQVNWQGAYYGVTILNNTGVKVFVHLGVVKPLTGDDNATRWSEPGLSPMTRGGIWR